MATTTTYTFANLPKPPGDAHAWTSAYQGFVSKNDAAGYLSWLWNNKRDTVMSQGFQFPASFTNPTATPATGTTTPTATTPVPITPAAGGAGAVPIPAPQDIVMPALDYSGRFGDYHASPYVLGKSYAGPESPPPFAGGTGVMPNPGGSPSPAPNPGGLLTPPPPSPGGSPTPAPNPGGSPAPAQNTGGLLGGGGGNWNGGSGQYSGGLLGSGGGSGSTWGSGHTSGTSAPSPSGSSSYGTGDYIDLGHIGSSVLDAASYIPGNVGLGAGALQTAGQLYNTNVTDNIRRQMGISGLDVGQWVGSGLGFNNYGNLNGSNIDIASPDQWHNPMNNQPTGINTGGLYQPGLFSRIGDWLGGEESAPGRMTLTEAQHRNAYASLPAGFFTPASSSTTPTAAAPAPAIPKTYSSPIAAPQPSSSSSGTTSTTSRINTPTYGLYHDPATGVDYSVTANGTYATAAKPGQTVLGTYNAATGSFNTVGGATDSGGSYSSVNAGSGGNSYGGYGGSYGSGDSTAVGASGQLGHIATGGYIGRGSQVVPPSGADPRLLRSDGKTDNQPMMADEGEFVIQRQAAGLLGRGVLKSLNDPKKAKKIRGLLRSAA